MIGDVELLVVDGVSTDGTIEIVEEFTRQDPRVRLLSEEDSSPLEAIHKGLRLATGHILATQTSSDYYCPGIFRQVVREFRQNSKLFAVGGGCPEVEADGQPRPTPEDDFYHEPTQLTVEDVFMWRHPPLQASFFRREVLFAYGGFDERFNTCHSAFFLHFLLEGFRMGGEIWMVPEQWASFRRHGEANHKLVQQNVQDIFMERSWATTYAVEVFGDFLTESQKRFGDGKLKMEVASILKPISTWIKEGNLQQAVDYFDSHKHYLLEDTPEIRQLHELMAKVRRIIDTAA